MLRNLIILRRVNSVVDASKMQYAEVKDGKRSNCKDRGEINCKATPKRQQKHVYL